MIEALCQEKTGLLGHPSTGPFVSAATSLGGEPKSDSMGMFWHGLAWHLMEWDGWGATKMAIARPLLPPRQSLSGSYFASPQSTSFTALYLLFMAGKAARQSVCDATLVQILQHTAMAACQVWFLDPAGQSG